MKRRVGVRLTLIGVLVALHTSFVGAIPPPKNPAELLSGADIAGRFRVLAVTQVATVRIFNEQCRVFQSRLQPVKFTKSPTVATTTIVVQWHDLPSRPAPGMWTSHYRAGEVVETYLSWDEVTGTYKTYWWNAKTSVMGGLDALPEQVGDVIWAPNGSVGAPSN